MRVEINDMQILHETAAVYGWSEDIGIHALASAVNSLMAAGAVNVDFPEEAGADSAKEANGTAIGAGIHIAYPPHADKPGIYRMEKRIRKVCGERKIEVLESRIYEQPLLCIPSVTINGIAAVPGKGAGTRAVEGKLPAGADIVLSKWVGMDGMLQIASEKKEELLERFTPGFIRQTLSYEKELFAGKEIETACHMGVLAIRQITRGGIFAALWELAVEGKTGLDLDLKRFLILQETVEVCEYFRLNPYQMSSAGSFLFVTADGETLKEALIKEGIMASVIGKTVKGQGKVIRNGEDVRFIDRPAPEELWKLYMLEGKRCRDKEKKFPV